MKWIIAGIIFCFLETAYFGFNFYAQSHAERRCDQIAVILVAIGVIHLYVQKEINRHKKELHKEED